MNKQEYIKRLNSLGLDKKRFCIISGGVMLLYGLKDATEDIDIKMRPNYFDEIKGRFPVRKSPKYDYLYELNDFFEVAVLDYQDSDVRIVNGYPVKSLELQLEWMLSQNREKDKEKIKIIQRFLKNQR